MTSNAALAISSLDPDGLKQDFVTWLQGQSQFKSYNFSGGNFNRLLDVLSYNTFLNAFLKNMTLNEMFLDSCQLYDSAASGAKELSYTPRSWRSAVSYVDVTVVPGDDPPSITMPAGTVFTSRTDNTILSFTTSQDIVIVGNGQWTAANVAIYEGTYVTETFTVNTALDDQTFVLSNPQVDTTSLTVTVQPSSTSTTNYPYLQANSAVGVGPTSNVYFLQAAANGSYQLVFGDGNVGSALQNQNIVAATYRVTSGDLANFANSFVVSGTIGGYPNVVVTTIQSALGGAPQESIQSIKTNAPRAWQAQGRAVTEPDYEILVTTNFPEIQAVKAYGGETLNPPQYGKTYIAVLVEGANSVSTTEINRIQSFLQTKVVGPFQPIVVNPDHAYVVVSTQVRYDVSQTAETAKDIVTAVTNAIVAYDEQNLENFGVTLSYDTLFPAIRNSDPAIVGSNTQVQVYKPVWPNPNASGTVSFQNPIMPGSVTSTLFQYKSNQSCFFEDDAQGNLRISTFQGINKQVVAPAIGTVNYGAGSVTFGSGILTSNNVLSYVGVGVNLLVTPQNQNFTVSGNTVLSVDASLISVNAIPVTV